METKDLRKSTKFLDLTIILKNNYFETKAYQKSMNLFLCIPEHSAHPPGLIKSLIQVYLKLIGETILKRKTLSSLQDFYMRDYLYGVTTLIS